MLTVGDLYSGIGGMSLGFRMAGGFETRWFCEVDPFCVKVLNKHWPGVPVYGDVRELRGSDIEPVDVLVGGFPCQPVSVAGRRKGDADDRWLWPEFARLIREIRPRWVLAENVPGLRSVDDGRLFGNVLRDLAASGYDAEWDCIPAAAVGAHHQRDRVWIVAYPTSVRCVGRDTHQRRREHETVGRCQLTGRDGANRDVADTSGFPKREQTDEADTIAVGGQTRSLSRGGRLPPREDVADADGERPRSGWIPSCQRTSLSDVDGRGSRIFGQAPRSSDFWDVEPAIQRVLNGVPPRLVEDRLRAIGNAVVPQVVELIARRIAATEGGRP